MTAQVRNVVFVALDGVDGFLWRGKARQCHPLQSGRGGDTHVMRIMACFPREKRSEDELLAMTISMPHSGTQHRGEQRTVSSKKPRILLAHQER